MRLCRRSSTSDPLKGRGAPQISWGMTRLRVALEGIILATFESDREIAVFARSYQSSKPSTNLIGPTIYSADVFAYLLCKHDMCFFDRLFVLSRNFLHRDKKDLIRTISEKKLFEGKTFSKNFNFYSQLREIVFLCQTLSAMIIKIATCRISPSM